MNFWAGLINQWAQQQPTSIAFEDANTKISYSQLADFSASFRDAVGELGLTSTDRILVSLPRGSASATVMTGLLTAALPSLPIERGQLASTLVPVVASLEPRAILCLDTDLAMIAPKIAHSTTIEIESSLFPRERVRLLLRPRTETKQTPNQAAWFLQTSGSTREPRIVTISHSNLIERAQGEVRDFKLTTADRVLNALSFSHDVGLNQFLSSLVSGGSLVIHNEPFATAFLRKIESKPAMTGISGTPLMWTQLFALTKGPFPGFRYATVSGGSLAAGQLAKLQDLFPRAELLRTYGQTETFRSLLNRSKDFESLGKPIAGVTLEIRNESGASCAAGEIGELIHVGSGEMIGYFDEPAASGEKNAHPGIRTGDFFRRDERGRFHYHGRRDDMVKRFDSRLHLGEIEATVAAIPGITTAIAVTQSAAENDPRENLIAIFVELAPGSHVSNIEIMTFCKAQMATWKHPDEIRIVSELPRTESFKPDRRKLLADWKSS